MAALFDVRCNFLFMAHIFSFSYVGAAAAAALSHAEQMSPVKAARGDNNKGAKIVVIIMPESVL